MTNEELYYLPASELLKHIKEEKERLIKEKLLKKQKELPPITEDEKPYDLPDEWEWVRLGDIGDWGAGATPLRSNSAYYTNGTVPWIKTGELNDGCIGIAEEYITELALKETSVRLNKPGDVLIAMYGATIGKLGILNIEATSNQACCACTVFNRVNNKYLFYYLRSMREDFKSMSEGGAQPNISKDKITKTIIPLPPLYIQDQIVQKLEQLSEIKNYLLSHAESQSNYTKKMREALLQEAIRGELVPQDENAEPASVLLEKIKAEKERLIKDKVIKKQKDLPPITKEEKPYDLPIGWEWVRLGEYFDITMGSSPKGNTVGDNLEGIEFHQGKVYFTDKYLKQSPQKTVEPTKVAIPNDVLLSVRAPVGTVNITQREICIGRGLCAIRPFLSDTPHHFIYYVLNAIKEEFIKQATGTTFIAITADVIRNQIFPLPPLAEQKRIVSKLNELMANCNQLEVKAEEMKNYTSKLFEAGLKEAFMPEYC